MATNHQPEGYATVTATLIVDDAKALIHFMSEIFGATERMRMEEPDGKVAHAEVMIGDSAVMVADSSDHYPAGSGFLHVYVRDADAVYAKALAAGASSINEPLTHFYGDRSANVRDRWGNRWTISTHVQDFSEQTVAEQMAAAPA